jgi:hypothetical protein
MSALGQKQTLADDSWMSALCHKQTSAAAKQKWLFDHFIGK